MGSARAADLHQIEVDAGAVDELEAVGARIRRFKRDCRNVWWRWRRGGGFRSHSRAQGFSGIILDGGRWRVVARVIADLSGAALRPLADRLRRIWPSVKIAPVIDQTGAAMACWPDFENWPDGALNYLNTNRNLQLLRISIRPAGARRSKSAGREAAPARIDTWADQPLPVVF